MIWSSATEIWMKTTWFGFSTALQTFIQRYFSMQMLTLHCDLYEWRRVRSAHTQLLLDISGDLRRCVGSQISAIASIFPIELTRSTWLRQNAYTVSVKGKMKMRYKKNWLSACWFVNSQTGFVHKFLIAHQALQWLTGHWLALSNMFFAPHMVTHSTARIYWNTTAHSWCEFCFLTFSWGTDQTQTRPHGNTDRLVVVWIHCFGPTALIETRRLLAIATVTSQTLLV